MKFYLDIASEWALKWEMVHLYVLAWIIFFTVIVFLGVFVFAVKYRRRSESERPPEVLGSVPLEIVWSVIPLIIGMTMFVSAAALYYEYASPPPNAMEIYLTGKQWMFHIQHPEGQREINEIHVPIGKPVKVTMSSEDVIHSFFVPAFRLKRDIIPGRYTSVWFTATKPGKYNLFCAEYCGSQHSVMGGWVYAMEPSDYEAWLAGGGMGSMAQQGEKLFNQFGCASCHQGGAAGRCPVLTNVFGTNVQLQGGATVRADEVYVRESILNPGAKIVAGYQNIMPSFQGQISEQNLLQIMAYIKSLAAPTVALPGTPGAASGPTRFRGGSATQGQGAGGTGQDTVERNGSRPNPRQIQ